MATVRKSNHDWNGKPYWGLVQQNGPWESTPGDIKRASEKDFGTFGGGIGVGGIGHRGHNGHANFAAFINPYQMNAGGAPPPPSGYARPTVMMAPVDMKRVTKMGKAKQGLTLAARTPLQTGQKMGKSREETTQTEAGDIMPPVVVEGTTQFGSTHHIMEMPRTREIGMMTRPGGRSIGSATNLVNTVVMGTSMSPVTTSFPVNTGTSMSPTVTDTVMAASPNTALKQALSAPTFNPVPGTVTYYPIEIPDVPIEIDDIKTEDYPIEYQSPDIVDTVMIQNLNMTQEFLNSIADYDKAQMARMQKKRDSFKETDKPIGVSTGKGKKTALDGTVLAEKANAGLTDGSSKPMSEKAKGKRPTPIVTSPTETSTLKPKTPSPRRTRSKPKKETGPSKPAASSAEPKPVPKPGPSKPAAKTVPTRGRPATRGETVSRSRSKSPGGPVKVNYQRVTKKGAAALYKKFGYKIKDRFESMKEDDVQYKITKAAYELYRNDK
jgi:hypothetical protein